MRFDTALTDFAEREADLAAEKTMALRIATLTITTSSSMRVNPVWVTMWATLRACTRRRDDPGRAPAEKSARQASKPMRNNLTRKREWDVFMLFVIFDQ